MGGETVTAFAVRTLKEAMHVRVNPDPAYTLLGQYTVMTKQGAYFVYPQFRDALGPLPRRCNLHVAVDGHGEYFILLIKQPNPGQDSNAWYQTAAPWRRRRRRVGSRFRSRSAPIAVGVSFRSITPCSIRNGRRNRSRSS